MAALDAGMQLLDEAHDREQRLLERRVRGDELQHAALAVGQRVGLAARGVVDDAGANQPLLRRRQPNEPDFAGQYPCLARRDAATRKRAVPRATHDRRNCDASPPTASRRSETPGSPPRARRSSSSSRGSLNSLTALSFASTKTLRSTSSTTMASGAFSTSAR